MTLKIGIALVSAGALLAIDGGTPAQAQQDVRDSYVLQVADGENCGRTRRDENGREREGDNYQACAEHATLVQSTVDPRNIVMFRLASKDVLNGVEIFDRAQLACTSITLEATGPVVNIDKYVTRNDGHQYRNAHASSAVALPTGDFFVMYNYRPNNNTERYGQVFDANCNSLSDQTLVIAKNNDDVCASTENSSHIVYATTGDSTHVGYTCGGNGNGRDDGWFGSVAVTKLADGTYDIDPEWDLSIEPREERTRMTAMYIPSQEMFGVCASAGNAQPTDRGVRCYGVDARLDGEQGSNADSRLLWREYVAERDGRIYQTQIKLAPSLTVENEATASWTTLVRRNRRGKGSTTMNLTRLAFSREGLDIKTLPVQNGTPGFDATHRTMLPTPWGVDGEERDAFIMYNFTINGSPAAETSIQVLSYDATNNQFVRHRSLGINSAIDSGWISNIYGNNPHTQGRNHTESAVFTNPWYQQVGGFKPEVKTWVATAATPRLMREGADIAQDKLAFQLVLTPAVVAPEAEPEPEPEEPLEPSDPDDTDPDDTDPNTDPGDTDPDDSDPNTGSSFGGCSTSGTSNGLGTLALLGLAFAVTRRRRRRS